MDAEADTDVAAWDGRRHGELNYHLTQFLFGHGYLNSFLLNICKALHPGCSYCEDQKIQQSTPYSLARR